MEQREQVTRKISGWEIRLFDAIEAARGRPFSWGAHDCLTWAADVMAAITGQPSRADAWRGKYKTEIGAARRLKKDGFASTIEAVTIHMGPPLPAAVFAQRGDLVADPEGAIGICIGYEAAFVGTDGLYGRPITECRAAWRI